MRLLCYLAICIPLLAATNAPTYHASFAWDTVSNASWYSVIVRNSNGVEIQRRYSMTNSVTVSNLFYPLDQYRFTAIATNSLGESDETAPAGLHWVTIFDFQSTNISGPWMPRATNSFMPTNQLQFFKSSISNFNANTLLKLD
jgi:hypothetical protein